MKYFLILTLLIFTFSLYSCITYDNAFIRNLTNATATIDVYLLNTSSIKSLPNQVTLANKIVKFKGGYKKYFDNIQNVIWIDTNHFKLEIEPNTTLNLEHMLGSFVNSFPEYDARLRTLAVIVARHKTFQ